MQKGLYKEGYTQNRELSWLRFDERCLNEAKDKTVPVLERLKFVAIFSSNLDEFFSVRVGSLTEMKKVKPDFVDNKSGLTPDGQLKKIYAEANRLCKKREEVFADLVKELKKQEIQDLKYEDCTGSEKKYLKRVFRDAVEPLLGAQIVDARHPLPQLQSGVIYAAGVLKYRGHEVFAVVPVPSTLPRIVRLPDKDGEVRFVHMEDLVLHNMESVFRGATIRERLKFYIIRNADVDVDDDKFDDILDYREKMMQMLRQRKRTNPVRIVCSAKPGKSVKNYLYAPLKLNDSLLYVASMPLDSKFMYQVSSLLSKEKAASLLYPPYTPKLSTAFDYNENLFDQVEKKDVLLSYPYESMDPFVLLIKESSRDPEVTSIKITIYRLAEKARLVDYLCQAAENGKEVDVLIELKARFDEQNNIDYSERLQDASVNVMYGFEDYKVHSKICLITRMKNKKAQNLVLIATGNFNENTAKQYTDLAYLTCRKGITRDAVAFFQNMMIGRLDGNYRYLLVSPVSLKSRVLDLIDEEIKKGESGRIIIKENSITDEDIIRKLHDASQAGVKIDMIVRGICCILPEVPGATDNLHVRSIVGRYLEHSRIYVFGKGTKEKMYISSADFMTRNTERRVEIACPIQDPSIRKRIHAYLDLCFRDNTKARTLGSDGKYHRIHDDKPPISCQDEMMRITKGSTQTIPRTEAHQLKARVFSSELTKKKKKKAKKE